MVDEAEALLLMFYERNQRYPTVEEAEEFLSLVRKTQSLSDKERQRLRRTVLGQVQNKFENIRRTK